MERRPGIVPRQAGRFFRPPRLRPWHVIVPLLPKTRAGRVTFAPVIYGFAAIIGAGALLLMLPISSQSGEFTRPVDALFTATSAVCVTGLAVLDTPTHWSFFGQAVLLALIQLGGLGFMTAATLFLLAIRRRISLGEQWITGQTLGLERYGDLPGLIRRIAVFTFVLEGIGAALIFLRLVEQQPPTLAAWRAVFQAVSAFNNCGLDLLGPNFRSLIGFQGDALTLLTTAALIILGGIGFVTIEDVLSRRRFAKLSVDSKMVLVTTLALLAAGTLFFLLAETTNPNTLGPLAAPQRVLVAFFQSVVPRTAGFTSVDVGKMVEYSLFFTILLMYIGGASGSTAGGIKVNTFSILFVTSLSSLRGEERATVFGREIMPRQVYRALALALLYLALVYTVALVLVITEGFSFLSLLFETFSAFGTVGLSTGITPGLSIAGRLIITVSMFIGRVGPLTLMSFFERQQKMLPKYPETTIRIG